MDESRANLFAALTFGLHDLYMKDGFVADLREIRLQFQNGGLRRPTFKNLERLKDLEGVLMARASIPGDFTGEVIISMDGPRATGCRWEEKNAGGPDDPPRSFIV